MSNEHPAPCMSCWCLQCDRAAAPSWRPGMSVIDQLLATAPMRMNLCPDCGNKRCPRATWHLHRCTGSNEPGQRGSEYCDGAEAQWVALRQLGELATRLGWAQKPDMDLAAFLQDLLVRQSPATPPCDVLERLARDVGAHCYRNRHAQDEPSFAFGIGLLQDFVAAVLAEVSHG